MFICKYLFLLYAQPPEINDQTAVTTTTPIQPWDVTTFAREVGLGDPLGGTFFRV
ncbi:hypothetical protein BDV98DRAFT_517729 [Pterulicium gracile]|uniref:Uncharacterized protein n=1 Tax=Pterulicium gracile TaxID=1884261 RepID=A0A5C3Q1D6_9AGAR|nr:hypothetical protein BDV98DRAFT_517729 [Pterula gracilis]